MRKRPIALMLLAAATLARLVTVPAWAGDGSPAADASHAPRPGAPGAEHRQLAALAGRWSVTQSMWTDPAKPPAIDHGTATFTPILGGRHLRQDLRIESKGAVFEGVGYLGYDRATGSYESLWMDVNFTGTIVAHGAYDPARQAYDFVAAVPDPARHGATLPLREVMHVRDADHFSYAYYERRGGEEALAVRLEYTRLK
jgi:hypothetical protein